MEAGGGRCSAVSAGSIRPATNPGQSFGLGCDLGEPGSPGGLSNGSGLVDWTVASGFNSEGLTPFGASFASPTATAAAQGKKAPPWKPRQQTFSGAKASEALSTAIMARRPRSRAHGALPPGAGEDFFGTRALEWAANDAARPESLLNDDGGSGGETGNHSGGNRTGGGGAGGSGAGSAGGARRDPVSAYLRATDPTRIKATAAAAEATAAAVMREEQSCDEEAPPTARSGGSLVSQVTQATLPGQFTGAEGAAGSPVESSAGGGGGGGGGEAVAKASVTWRLGGGGVSTGGGEQAGQPATATTTVTTTQEPPALSKASQASQGTNGFGGGGDSTGGLGVSMRMGFGVRGQVEALVGQLDASSTFARRACAVLFGMMRALRLLCSGERRALWTPDTTRRGFRGLFRYGYWHFW